MRQLDPVHDLASDRDGLCAVHAREKNRSRVSRANDEVMSRDACICQDEIAVPGPTYALVVLAHAKACTCVWPCGNQDEQRCPSFAAHASTLPPEHAT